MGALRGQLTTAQAQARNAVGGQRLPLRTRRQQRHMRHGTRLVGRDIKAGMYHTNGSGNTGANDCYFATLNSIDTSNIADNNNFDGPETVDVSSAYAFEANGPCTWVKVG
jgi:hypothetical protein